MNALVAYFSATGTTAKAAKALADAVGGELYEIKPAVPYTSADLNWMDKGSRSSVEMKDPHSRPGVTDLYAPDVVQVKDAAITSTTRCPAQRRSI